MQIEPYLAFGGRCEEALAFYAAALGGKVVRLTRFEGSPMDKAGKVPAQMKQKVMHAIFEADGARFLASDNGGGGPGAKYVGFSMSVSIPADPAKARRVFDELAVGGKVTLPFNKMFWGAEFGLVTDKFGVQWMINATE